MHIDIENGLSDRFNFDFEKNIKYILSKVPPEHIQNLHKIQVLRYSPERHRRDACGFYYGKIHGEKLPRIVICADNLFRHFPKLLFRLTFIPKIFLARTLFHEIAHHYQKNKHGLKRHKWEKDADSYMKIMVNKHFRMQLILLSVIFGPLIFIHKLLKKTMKSNEI